MRVQRTGELHCTLSLVDLTEGCGPLFTDLERVHDDCMRDVRSVAMGGNHTGRDVITVERLIAASLV